VVPFSIENGTYTTYPEKMEKFSGPSFGNEKIRNYKTALKVFILQN